MEMPTFLLCDCTANPDDMYVLHTDYPRFLLNLATDEIELFDEVSSEDDPEEFEEELRKIVERAGEFYESEINEYTENE